MTEDESTRDDTAAREHPTRVFAAYQPPPPPGGRYPDEPGWSVTGDQRSRRGRRRPRLAVALGVASAFALGLASATASVNPIAGVAGLVTGSAEAAGPADYDLQRGAVFVATNAAGGNEVVAFARAADGTLREAGRYPTGGNGSGSPEDSAQGLVLGSAQGESSPAKLEAGTGQLLYAVNAGSNTISVFKVQQDRLELVTQVPSGGEKPVSLTVNRGLLYVLNSGEFDDRLITNFDPVTVLQNCAHGQLPSVTGFRVSPEGQLAQIPNSTRLLSGAAESGCAQVSFTPDGTTLVASERIAGTKDAEGLGRGAFITFPVNKDGTLGPKTVTRPTGSGPFGFTFTKDGGTLLSTEQVGALPDRGQVASYSVANGTLTPVGRSVPTGTTDTCWIVLTDDQKLAFTSSPFGGGALSSLKVGKDGRMTVLHPVATADDGKDLASDRTPEGLLDLSLTRDSGYLYVISGVDGAVYGFKVNPNGTLTLVDRKHVVNLLPFDQGGQGGPFGLAAS